MTFLCDPGWYVQRTMSRMNGKKTHTHTHTQVSPVFSFFRIVSATFKVFRDLLRFFAPPSLPFSSGTGPPHDATGGVFVDITYSRLTINPLRIWARETGSAVPSCASPFILQTQPASLWYRATARAYDKIRDYRKTPIKKKRPPPPL